MISGTQKKSKLKGKEKQREKMMMLGMGLADSESAVGFDERDVDSKFYQTWMAKRRGEWKEEYGLDWIRC